MIRNITATPATIPDSPKSQSHGANFAKVLDGSKRPIRGLWIRNGRFYARLNIQDLKTGITSTRRVPLVDTDGQPVRSVSEAKAELGRLHVRREENNLPMLRQNPKFGEYVPSYLDFIGSGQGSKQKATVAKEKGSLSNWVKQLGELRLDQIKRYHINDFIKERLKSGRSPRTVNLDMIALRNVLNHAIEEQRITRLPTEGMKPLKTTTVRRPFFNTTDLATLCQAAFLTKLKRDRGGATLCDDQGNPIQVPLTKNAQEFVDYLRLLAYSGARRNEALALQWEHVDFQSEQLTIGASGGTKNRKPRVVDLNENLKRHLLDMQRRRAPDSQWLFPSPQRGRRDVPLKTLRESLDLVRAKAQMPGFQFHDCRHHFISMSVMAGIDFMTIAAWVGHQDGGVLIGKVYGHLANEHRKRMASKLVFEPVILEERA